MIYYIYIVECSGDKLYTGIATDYKRRFEEHKEKTDKSAKFTKSFFVKKIVALYKTEGRSLASKLEYRIKQLTKQQKIDLINNNKYFKIYFKNILDVSKYKRIKINTDFNENNSYDLKVI